MIRRTVPGNPSQYFSSILRFSAVQTAAVIPPPLTATTTSLGLFGRQRLLVLARFGDRLLLGVARSG